ncbi:uncharacterized protein NPIL_328391 [Nephila pilipes]|uniref:Histone-lysine N-methyltransferase SETMAR n=1 Tax=Nephila pilipes TaxID=299642 RepID=A0A8X6TNS4_NEPPI|nr:uncharacterized protein NPIL_328391 [Nephila pilipes]
MKVFFFVHPHTTNMTKDAIQMYGFEGLLHPPYSLRLAPMNFSHVRSLSKAMWGVSFNTDAELRAWLKGFFESKPDDFYQDDIEN